MLEPSGGQGGGFVDGRTEWFYEEQADPVYEGMVKDFDNFHDSLEAIHESLEAFMSGVEQLAGGLRALSEGVVDSFSSLRDQRLVSDGRTLREATNQILYEEAPDSALGKLRRNLDFNIITPIKEHIENNGKLRKEMEKRQRRLEELREAKRQVDICTQCNLDETDKRFVIAQTEFATSQKCFREVDRYVFEWLYLLEEYRGDILDSSLQTLKFLQYQFFSASAHAIHHTLPARMEFRPMEEMQPEHLQAQVESGRQRRQGEQEADADDWKSAGFAGFSERLAKRMAKGESETQEEPQQCVVDVLSLSSLMAQGFDESRARRALRLHGNDTQQALEWLLDDDAGVRPVVRNPRSDAR